MGARDAQRHGLAGTLSLPGPGRAPPLGQGPGRTSAAPVPTGRQGILGNPTDDSCIGVYQYAINGLLTQQ